MSPDQGPGAVEPEERTAGSGTQIHPALWVLLGAAIVLLLGSFTGSGTGLFGWGFLMSMMWLWMGLPVLVVVLLVVLLTDRAASGR